MWNQDRRARRIDTSPGTDWGDPAEPRAVSGSDDVVPIRETVRPWALQILVAAYGGGTYPLLTDLLDLLGASVAHVDPLTLAGDLGRALSDGDWSAGAPPLTPIGLSEAPRGARTP